MKCYYLAEPVFSFATTSDAQRESLHKLLFEGLIRETKLGANLERTYRATNKGKAWIEMILNTPLPVRTAYYEDPRTGEPVKHNGVLLEPNL